MGLLDKLLNKAAEKIGDAVKQGTQSVIKPVVQKAEDKISDAVQKAEDKVADAAHKAAEKAAESLAQSAEKKENAEAKAGEAAEKAGPASFEEAAAACSAAGAAADAEGVKPGWGEGGVDSFWDKLDNEWKNDQAANSGYVWTVTVDDTSALDAMGLAKMKYGLQLSCSHVGPARDGVYKGSLALVYGADLSGITAMIGSLGGRTSANRMAGWFRNDNFIMKLSPDNKEKEEGFIGSLDLVMDENHEVVQKPSDPYTDAIAGPMLAQMAAGKKDFETESDPDSYWFDWDYHMTSGDIAQSYAISGVLGMANAHAELSGDGGNLNAAGKAVTPWGVYTDRYEKDYDAPFPYVIRVYGNDKVVFELHSPEGGPVTIKFYGHIDRISVSQTTVVG